MNRTFPGLVLAAAVALAASSAGAAESSGKRAHTPVVDVVPVAQPADVASIDAIVGALYDVISGPAGQPRDWKRMRSLFVPGARLTVIGPRPEGGIGMRVLGVGDYVALSGPLVEKKGFHERELARRTERFGELAHVFSTYAGHLDGENKTMRGINSIQLMNDGTRWWIVSVMWEAEREGLVLPDTYLRK